MTINGFAIGRAPPLRFKSFVGKSLKRLESSWRCAQDGGGSLSDLAIQA